ncbi:MAG TPA: LysR family transcriptional regulator [Gaiellaceae bacterium]|nr:LysR family transcriptional regulator [Gaiellaceae bacterium]
MLDVRRMRMLREVALRGSIAAAAHSLSFTPSAVSQQLAKLEREAGVALLDRGPRSVRLTHAGRALVAHTEGILERLAEAEAELRELAGEEPALRVGSITTAGASILPAALTGLAAARPETAVTVTEADPLVSLARLRARELDVALVFEYDHVPLPRDERVELEVLVEEEMRVVLPAGHPAARARAVRLLDLADDPWIKSTNRSSCNPFTERACRAAGFEPRIAVEFDDYTAMQNLVAAGVGVAFAPDMGLRRPNPGVAVRPIAFGAPRRRVLVAFRVGEGDRPALAGMLAALRGAVSERRPLAAVS